MDDTVPQIAEIDDGPAAAGGGAASGLGGAGLTVAGLGGAGGRKLQKGGPGPSPFEVGLFSYPVQPWTNRNARLSQWFNYGLNPATWSKYALGQIALYQQYKNTVNEGTQRPEVAAAAAKLQAAARPDTATGAFDADAVLELE